MTLSRIVQRAVITAAATAVLGAPVVAATEAKAGGRPWKPSVVEKSQSTDHQKVSTNRILGKA